MFKPLKYIGRLLQVALTLSKYKALTPIKPMLADSLLLRLAFVGFNLLNPIKKHRKLSEGERLTKALQTLGPAFIKLGQTLATRPDIVGDELAKELSLLQDRLPAFDEDEVVRTVEGELGGTLDRLFKDFNTMPKAAASIAQVHFATTHEGGEVAIKILRPGIRRLFSKDLDVFFWVAKILEKYSDEARRLRLGEIVATIESSVIAETNLLEEAASAEQLAHNMRDFEGYRIPKIYMNKTTERILTMERIHGIPIHDIAALNKAGHNTSRLSETIVHAFLRQAIEDGFFHADLHQGNLLVEADGTIVAIDFGIMGKLDEASKNFLGEILWGFQQRDFDDIARVHFEAGYVPKTQSFELFADAMRDIAEPIIDKPISEISFGHLLAKLMATTRKFSMQTQPQLLMLQRSMVMVEGLALSLDENANMWQLSRPELVRFVIHEKRLPQVIENILTKMPFLFEIWLLIADMFKNEEGEKEKLELKQFIADIIALGILFIISNLTPRRT